MGDLSARFPGSRRNLPPLLQNHGRQITEGESEEELAEQVEERQRDAEEESSDRSQAGDEAGSDQEEVAALWLQ